MGQDSSKNHSVDNRYTGENLQNTVIPARLYPDLSRVNTTTTERVAPPATNPTITQRVAPPTANTTTQRVAFPSSNTATTQRVASPTVTPAQKDASPAAREGHVNCYSGARCSSQRVAPPTTNAATIQRVASPTVTPAQKDASPAAKEGRVNCYISARGSSQRVPPPATNAATTQRVASPTVTPAQKDASSAALEGHFNCYSGAHGSSKRVAPPSTNAATTQRVSPSTTNATITQRVVPPTAKTTTQRVAFPSSNTATTQRVASPTVTPAQKDASPASREGHVNCYSSANGSSQRVAPPTTNYYYYLVDKYGEKQVRSPNDRFTCPTSGLLLGVTIFFCQRGHSACQECQQGNRLCGERPGELCRTPIENIRNISVEALVAEHLILQRSVCPNAGCTLSYNMADMAQHQRVCPFGETDCPMGTLFGQCQQRYKVDAMASHFDEFHRVQRLADIGKEIFIINFMESQEMFLIKNGPHNFLVHVKVAENDRNIYMTVQLVGTAVSASKWSYEFHVYNKAQPRRKFLFVDNCHSVATSVDDIFKEAKCAAIPLNFAMKFFTYNGVLTYKFYVKKTERNKPTRRNNWKRQNQQV